MADSGGARTVGVVLFQGFELLDVFGPLEVLGAARERFEVRMIGPERGELASIQGPCVVTDAAYRDADAVDIVLVPGGFGNRRLVTDHEFLRWLAAWAQGSEFVTSVCTGSALLAAAGLLDGYRATSNKRFFSFAASQGEHVEWVPSARWVEDRDRWTSSGVAAGIDMTLALVARLHGEQVAEEIADQIEYEWHRNAEWDPFAAKNGLV